MVRNRPGGGACMVTYIDVLKGRRVRVVRRANAKNATVFVNDTQRFHPALRVRPFSSGLRLRVDGANN